MIGITETVSVAIFNVVGVRSLALKSPANSSVDELEIISRKISCNGRRSGERMYRMALK